MLTDDSAHSILNQAIEILFFGILNKTMLLESGGEYTKIVCVCTSWFVSAP